MGERLRKHRNLLLISLLTLTMAVSFLSNQHAADDAAAMVTLPVAAATKSPLSALEAYRQKRESALQHDMTALEALVNESALDPQTRADAAAQLQRLTAKRQRQLDLEGALLQSSVSPCVAVVDEGSVTIVTEKTDLTEGETALVLTLAQLHAGVSPSGVRVITAQAEK